MDLLKFVFIVLGVLFIIITFKFFIINLYVFGWVVKILIAAIIISLIIYLIGGNGNKL
jgi:uncharacterized membrane protein